MNKIVFTAILALGCLSSGVAQIIKIDGNRNASTTLEEYKFKVKMNGQYTVSVIGPSGELQSRPANKKKVSKGQVLYFQFDTKWWREGRYQILIENHEGFHLSKDILIKKTE